MELDGTFTAGEIQVAACKLIDPFFTNLSHHNWTIMTFSQLTRLSSSTLLWHGDIYANSVAISEASDNLSSTPEALLILVRKGVNILMMVIPVDYGA